MQPPKPTQEQRREINRLKAKIFRERYKANGPSVIRTKKQCCQCEHVKPIADFARCISAADWHSSTCRSCSYEKTKQWRKLHPDKVRKHGREQSQRATATGAYLKYSRKYYANNKQKCHDRQRQWKTANRAAYREIQRAFHRKRMAADPTYKFSVSIRSKIRLLMRGLRKSAPTEILLGCKIPELRKWLELLWQPGMSWENYGLRGWHIDHKRPVHSFDLSKPEDQRACFHYTNLQPLWAADNIRKSNKLIDEIRLRSGIPPERIHCLQEAQGWGRAPHEGHGGNG